METIIELIIRGVTVVWTVFPYTIPFLIMLFGWAVIEQNNRKADEETEQQKKDSQW